MARTDGGPPTHTDQGKHLVKYAIWPYTGSWSTSGLQKRAHQFTIPLVCQFRRGTVGRLLAVEDAITTVSGNLEIVAMKKPEDEPQSVKSLIIRVVEQGRLQTRGKLMFSRELNVVDVKLVDLIEREYPEQQGTVLDITRKDGAITSCVADWNPHEILTFKITRA